MKTTPIHPGAPSLGKDANGTIRIGGTRVPFETVITAFQEGATPEEIVLRFDVLTLPQTYEAVSYYLNQREEAEAYLEGQREKGTAMQREAERRGATPGQELRARLRRRKEADERENTGNPARAE